jgi:hypothetical protein
MQRKYSIKSQAPYSNCIMVGSQNLTISGIFTTDSAVSKITVIIMNVLNPSPAI